MRDKNILYESTIYLSEQSIRYKRIVYNLWDAFSDIGGIFQFVYVILGFFLFPISRHCFILDAASKIFLARTKDDGLFMKK